MKKLILSSMTACVLLAGAPAHAQIFNWVFGTKTNDVKREWQEGEFDIVRLEVAEAGAKNEHPVTLAPADIQASLQKLRIDVPRKGVIPVFTPEEAAVLSRGVSAALAKAKPEEDLVFISVGAYGEGLFAPRVGNSGRIFYANGQLNIILGEAHVDFVGTYRATRHMHEFTFGSRNNAKGAKMVAVDGVPFQANRSDWALVTVSAPAAPAAASPAPTGSASAPAAAAAPAPQANDGAQAEARLATLKRLFDKGLITEEEYKAKRREILEKL